MFARCPECQVVCPTVTFVVHSQGRPTRGDPAVCPYCLSFLVFDSFDSDLKLRLLTLEEVGSLADDDRIEMMRVRQSGPEPKGDVGKRYPKEFRQQMIKLHRAGRSIPSLSREFGCSQQAIRRWVKQADRAEDRGDDDLTTAEREELSKLERENRHLLSELETISKVAAWLAALMNR